jgi:hypothetical protein
MKGTAIVRFGFGLWRNWHGGDGEGGFCWGGGWWEVAGRCLLLVKRQRPPRSLFPPLPVPRRLGSVGRLLRLLRPGVPEQPVRLSSTGGGCSVLQKR